MQVLEEPGRRTVKLGNTELWKIYEDIGKAKMVVNSARCGISKSRWERSWAKFVRRAWVEETPAWSWDSEHCVYTVTVPYSRGQYIGETTRTIFGRWKNHLRKATRGGREAFYRFLERTGMHRGILTPLFMWGEGVATTKIQRLRREGEYIWERGSTKNEKGNPTGGAIVRQHGTVLFGRKTRHRLVVRRRDPDLKELTRKEKVEAGKKKSDEEAHLRGMAVRLARRPWKNPEPGKPEHKTLQEIRWMTVEKVKKLVKMVLSGLDGTSRSIARKNMKKVLRDRGDILWVHAKTRSPIMGDSRVKQAVEEEIKSWSNWARRNKRITVVIEHAVVSSATLSLTQILGNSEELARKDRSELKCH